MPAKYCHELKIYKVMFCNVDLQTSYISGLSGINLPVPKYLFPEEFQAASRLKYYSTFFNSLEVNSSHYKIPRERTVANWALDVNRDFKFTFKLSREITHTKHLDFDANWIEKFLPPISAVNDKKACVLIQFPPGLSLSNMHELERLFTSINCSSFSQGWRLAIEFRNKDWYNEDTYEILRANKASFVIHDMPASHTPMLESTSDFMYLRFHGPTGNYRGSYSEAYLAEYAGYIKTWISEGKLVFAYFNNTAGDAFNNLITLNRYLKTP
jgi:uncharacterized protein YecE (DUF72 family)